MEAIDILKTFLPCWLFDYFEAVKIEDSLNQIDIYLDEKKEVPSNLLDRPIISYGFTESYTVQDFPIRGKEVYLHIRRRKWMLTDTKQIVSRSFDIAHQGTRLTKEFVAFLKATN